MAAPLARRGGLCVTAATEACRRGARVRAGDDPPPLILKVVADVVRDDLVIFDVQDGEGHRLCYPCARSSL